MLELDEWIFDWELVWPGPHKKKKILANTLPPSSSSDSAKLTSTARPAIEREEAAHPLNWALTLSVMPWYDYSTFLTTLPPMQRRN